MRRDKSNTERNAGPARWGGGEALREERELRLELKRKLRPSPKNISHAGEGVGGKEWKDCVLLRGEEREGAPGLRRIRPRRGPDDAGLHDL